MSTTTLSADEVSRLLFDLKTARCRRDPRTVLDRLRDAGPVLRARDGSLVITSYDLVSTLISSQDWGMLDAQWRDQGKPGWREHPGLRFVHDGMLGLNEPDHLRHRRTALSRLARTAVTDLRPALDGFAEDLVDRFVCRMAGVDSGLDSGLDSGPDFAADVAERLPALALCSLLGLPLDFHERLAHLAQAASFANEAGPSPAQLRSADEGVKELSDYLARVEVTPGSYLAELREIEPMHPDELSVLVAGVLAVAGWETTAFSLSNAALLLGRYPQEAELLRSRPELLGSAVTEMLRFEPPVLAVMRQALVPTLVEEQKVEPGSVAYLLIGAAHRDPAAFPDPDRFDVARVTSRKPLTFGRGSHLCLGIHLTALESEILLAKMLERLPPWGVGHVDYGPGRFLRKVTSLRLTF